MVLKKLLLIMVSCSSPDCHGVGKQPAEPIVTLKPKILAPRLPVDRSRRTGPNRPNVSFDWVLPRMVTQFIARFTPWLSRSADDVTTGLDVLHAAAKMAPV